MSADDGIRCIARPIRRRIGGRFAHEGLEQRADDLILRGDGAGRTPPFPTFRPNVLEISRTSAGFVGAPARANAEVPSVGSASKHRLPESGNSMKLGILIVRLVVGGVFVGHGLQKLKGYFDGPGLDGVEGMMNALEMHPPRRNAQAVALTETLGGAAIIAGAATPVAAAGLIATMLVAIRKVHWPKGVWNADGGFEYNAVLIAVVAAIAGSGPGRISLDALVGKTRWGALGGILAVVGGALGSVAAVELGKRSAPSASE